MSYNDDLPTWGATGSKPLDSTSRSPGDNIPASEYNYLWYILNETFGDIDTDLSNIEQGGVADDPHGNEEHSTNYLPSNNYNPVSDVEAKTSALNIDISGDADTVDGQDASAFADATHGNEAHSEDYITSGQVEGGAPDPHGNSSHSTNYLAFDNYNPVLDVEAHSAPLGIDIFGNADTVDGKDASDFADATHGNDAHSENYITSGEIDGGAPDPHGNSSHSVTFAVDGDPQPPENHGNSAHTATFAVDGVAQPPENHGNEAHSENYITSGEVDSGAPDPHGNSAHTATFAVDGDAQPPENHGDGAHSIDYLKRNEALAPKFRMEMHRLKNITVQPGSRKFKQFSFDKQFPTRPFTQTELYVDGASAIDVADLREVTTWFLFEDTYDAAGVTFDNEAPGEVILDLDVLLMGPRDGNSFGSEVTIH